MYRYVCICMHVCIYMCMHVCIYVYVCMCVCVYVCMCMHVCIYVYVCVCVCVCICVCVCRYAGMQECMLVVYVQLIIRVLAPFCQKLSWTMGTMKTDNRNNGIIVENNRTVVKVSESCVAPVEARGMAMTSSKVLNLSVFCEIGERSKFGSENVKW